MRFDVIDLLSCDARARLASRCSKLTTPRLRDRWEGSGKVSSSLWRTCRTSVVASAFSSPGSSLPQPRSDPCPGTSMPDRTILPYPRRSRFPPATGSSSSVTRSACRSTRATPPRAASRGASSNPTPGCTARTASSSPLTTAARRGTPRTAARSWRSGWTASRSMRRRSRGCCCRRPRPRAAPDGDRLTATTFIQRTRTTGGLPPAAAECNAATAGSRAEVPYTADYHFWKASSR